MSAQQQRTMCLQLHQGTVHQGEGCHCSYCWLIGGVTSVVVKVMMLLLLPQFYSPIYASTSTDFEVDMKNTERMTVVYYMNKGELKSKKASIKNYPLEIKTFL